MSITGAVHVAFAVAALVVGAVVLYLGAKGGQRHRLLGWTFVVSMLGANITAFMLYGLFGGFGPFHFAATISLISTTGGVLTARAARRARLRREPVKRAHRVEGHYWWMTFCYVGLFAAFTSELIVRVPAIRGMMQGIGLVFAVAVAGATAVTFMVGTVLIRGSRDRVLAPFLVRTAPPAA